MVKVQQLKGFTKFNVSCYGIEIHLISVKVRPEYNIIYPAILVKWNLLNLKATCNSYLKSSRKAKQMIDLLEIRKLNI